MRRFRCTCRRRLNGLVEHRLCGLTRPVICIRPEVCVGRQGDVWRTVPQRLFGSDHVAPLVDESRSLEVSKVVQMPVRLHDLLLLHYAIDNPPSSDAWGARSLVRQERARNAVALTTRGGNPSIDTAAQEHERIATDQTAINNLRAAKTAGEDPDAWSDPTTQASTHDLRTAMRVQGDGLQRQPVPPGSRQSGPARSRSNRK